LGGPAAAVLLQAAGFSVKVYEQAETFSRIGAGIHLTPNVVRILQRIGIAKTLAATGITLRSWVSRKADTGVTLLRYPLDECEVRYGAPFVSVHRGDFHASLIAAVAQGTVQLGKRLVDLDASGSVVRLRFADGSAAEADLVVGADGLRSRVREVLAGLERPRFIGRAAFRAIFSTSHLRAAQEDDCIKWWGDDRILLSYYITKLRKEIYIVTSVPQSDWPHETSSVPADMAEFRQAFDGFHSDVRELVAACPQATKWAQYDCEPLTLWSRGRVVLLGDACHPMTPYMGQGAAMAIEDAAMLARCMSTSPADIDQAIRLYAANRKGRTAKMQAASRHHDWLRDRADPDWVFGYDVFSEPLVSAPAIPGT
jgi:6-hydroxynicotinate 3-monooxygenase